MRILFLNLADNKPLGKKAVDALKKRYPPPDEVIQYNLMRLARDFRNNPSSVQLPNIPFEPNADMQIIVGAHGMKDDTSHCYCESDYENEKIEKLLTHEQLADFLNFILPLKTLPIDKLCNIILSICYAGRTADHSKNHIQEVGELDFADTFAQHFLLKIGELHPPLQVCLKAYTGAVSFGESTGELEVETEDQILVHAPRLEELDKKRELALTNLERLTDNSTGEPKSGSEKEYEEFEKEFDAIMKQKNMLLLHRPKANYGEIVYRLENGKVSHDLTNLKQRRNTVTLGLDGHQSQRGGNGWSSCCFN